MNPSKRYRLRAGVRVASTTGGGVQVLGVGAPVTLPAHLSTPLVRALLEALKLPATVASLNASLGGETGPLLDTLTRLGATERLVDAGTAVALHGDLPGFVALAATEGLEVDGHDACLAIWASTNDAPPLPVPVLRCTPWLEGVGAIGPLGGCGHCWRARVASHGAVRTEGLDVLSPLQRRVFVDAVLREVLALLSGRPNALQALHWRALDHERGGLSTHAFLPLDGCPRCSSCNVDRGEGVVDARSGVFAHVATDPMTGRRAPLFVSVARLADPRPLGRGETFRGAAGVAPTPEAARGKALGEGFERWCASVPASVAGSTPRPRSALNRPALDPAHLVLFSAAQHNARQFPYTAPTNDLALRWVEATALPSGESMLVPAQCVYMPYELDEPRLLPAQSHGLACAPTFDGAVRAGFLELVERDAFMRFWWAGRPAPHLGGVEHIAGTPRALLDECADRRWRLTIIDMRSDLGIPAVLTVARPDADGAPGPRLWIGAAAALDVTTAVERALLELFQNHRWLEREWSRRTPAPHPPSTYEERALYYTHHPEQIDRLSFLWEGLESGVTDVAPLPHDDVPRLLAQYGHQPLVVELTTSEARASGLCVVRTLVPGLVRVHADEAWPFLGGLPAEGPSNRLPHPFP